MAFSRYDLIDSWRRLLLPRVPYSDPVFHISFIATQAPNQGQASSANNGKGKPTFGQQLETILMSAPL